MQCKSYRMYSLCVIVIVNVTREWQCETYAPVVKLADIIAMHVVEVSPRFRVPPFAPLYSDIVRSLMAALDLGSSIPSGRRPSEHNSPYFSRDVFE